ncbi:MAG TPA: phosphate acyltransferase, partial [Dehalococcoidia bacterium]|nr:phosphate acyltransferase [Dehalococcoidia bacterium]
ITPDTPIFLIDAGANVDCRPEHLAWFANLGNLYVSQVLGISSPRIGLLSNGEEESKGSKLIKESHKLLKSSALNFIGNIEGQDILKRAVEVIVTDGFTGNIVLKTIEGVSDNWLNSLSQAGQVFAKAYRLPLRALHRDIGMGSWTQRLDYREYGGACLLGVNGNVIIAHGRSQSKAIKNAIGLAKQTVERGICQRIKEENYEQVGLHR